MKDPAFLFYSSDFLSGTMLMTDEEIGQYIKLLCLQHQKGHLKEKDMLNICKTYNEDIFSKFKKDEEGNYYNERLEYEANKRKAYSESRRNNRKKKETYEKDMKNICNSYEQHMGNANANENRNRNINKNNSKVNDSCVNDLQVIIDFYNENIGLITPYGLEILSSYAEEMDQELIILAMKKSVEANKRTIQYIKAILNNWSKQGIKTVLDAEQEDRKFRDKNNKTEKRELVGDWDD
jgi:DnaD/phage-associated family protein|nr:MAG TPA: DNA polymerase [Caudoviricetes sp.]